ncbi:ribosomal L24e-domain-containing protein [Chaetoceros tenuissimus]|uniref:Ribosomal L24e-domain-containing protein n=1 Tax=Chaetoceros tenuissimus TaxID=426638 RepID=A0AAD3CNG1_9STRA|nr:ribosomal L24e-domain-containing protein [Chaetoceros tenuissimus]
MSMSLSSVRTSMSKIWGGGQRILSCPPQLPSTDFRSSSIKTTPWLLQQSFVHCPNTEFTLETESFSSRKKPAKLVWTQAWRRLHKKGLAETTQKKRTRRVAKVARAVVGASLEDIKKKATRTSAQREAALKEVKARKTVAKDQKRADKARGSGAGQRTKLPKNVKR